MKRYLQMGYGEVDLVLREGFKRTLPFEWKELKFTSPAEAAFQSEPIGMDEAITAKGYYDSKGLFHAQTIVRAKDSRDLWPPDRGGN